MGLKGPVVGIPATATEFWKEAGEWRDAHMFAHLLFEGLWLPELTDLMNSPGRQRSKLPDGVVLAVWRSDYVRPVQ